MKEVWLSLFTLRLNTAVVLLNPFFSLMLSIVSYFTPCSIMKVLESSRDGLCIYRVDMLCTDEGVWECCFIETTVSCIWKAPSRSVYGEIRSWPFFFNVWLFFFFFSYKLITFTASLLTSCEIRFYFSLLVPSLIGFIGLSLFMYSHEVAFSFHEL